MTLLHRGYKWGGPYQKEIGLEGQKDMFAVVYRTSCTCSGKVRDKSR